MSITSRINEMSTHIEQAYDELQGLGADLTGIDKNIDNIASVLDDIYDDLPKVTGSGTSITLDDTRKGRLESTLSGNTSQFTTTGKNLLKNTLLTTATTTTGVTATPNSDGSVTLNGTASAVTYFNLSQYDYGSTSFSSNYGGSTDYIASIGVTQTGVALGFNGSNKYTALSVNNGVTVNNLKVYPMIRAYSVSDDTFEPYTGGQASPNPSYPQPVNVVSGDNKITVCGKNFLDLTGITARTVAAGITITPNFNGDLLQNIKISGTPTTTTWQSIKTFALGAGTYILSGINVTQTNKTGLRIGLYIDNARQWFITSNSPTYTFTLNETTACQFVIWVQSVADYPTGDIYLTPMIRVSSETDDTYEPYQSNIYNINLPVENLWGGFSNSFSRTDFGVQFTANQDGTITANGTATNTATSILLSEATSNGIYKTLQKGTYTVSGGGAKYNVEIYDKNNVVRLGGIDVNGSKVSFTINEETQIVLRIQVASGVTINETIKLQLETGSKANTYTPYGTTPIELAEISTYKDKLFRTSGKNLFNSNITPENYYYDNNGEKVYQSGVEYINQEINNVNYTSITISFLSSTGGASVRVCEYNLSGAFIARTLVNTNNQAVNLNNATTKIILSVNSDSNSYFTYLMINKGSSASDYQPYGVGKWYLHKEIGKVVLVGDNSEGWSGYADGSDYFYLSTSILETTGNYVDGYSSHFRCLTYYPNVAGTFAFRGDGKQLSIRVNGITSAADFKTWLETNKPIVYYILATPTYTKITSSNYPTLYSQLEAIYNAQSKENQTNISQVNNDLPFIISASALKEWQENTSLNSTLSMANPLSLGNTLNTQENNTQPIEVDNIEPLEEEENEES